MYPTQQPFPESLREKRLKGNVFGQLGRLAGLLQDKGDKKERDLRYVG